MKPPIIPRNKVPGFVIFLVIALFINVRAFAQIPLNNNCAGAFALTPAATCIAGTSQLTGQTLENATATSPVLATSCGNTGSPDVWYSFVASNIRPTITVSNLGASWTNTLRIQLYSSTGPCTGLAVVQCVSNAPLTLATDLIIGQTYYIRILRNVATATTGVGWTFDICVANPPANDLCANAISLTSYPILTPTAGTANYASNHTLPNNCDASAGGRIDVWYSFVAQSTNPVIINTLTAGSGSRRTELYSGGCGGLIYRQCSTSDNLNSTGLTVGQTYYVRVFSNNAFGYDFNISVVDPPANDLCVNAVPLTSASTCVSPTSGTLISATYTAGAGVPGASPCNGATLDVWYQFVAQTTNPVISTTTVAGGGSGGKRIELYQGTCSLLSSTLQCSGSDNFLTTGLTIGQTYYVRMYSTSSNPYNFTICIIDPPLNDLCANATPLSVGPTCSPTNGSLVGATYTTITSPCTGSRSDVWYSFTANTTSASIITTGNTNIRLQVYTAASCGGTVTSVGSCINTVSGIISGLTVGSQYLVRVYLNTGTASAFDVCVSDAPDNDFCGAPVTLTSGTTCTTTPGTVYAATLTAPTISGFDCSGGFATYDVWYRFVAATTNPTITLSNLGATFGPDAHLQLLSNNCGTAATSFYCGTTSIAANNLTPGTTYLIRVYGTGALPTGMSGNNFDICITDPVSNPQTNDECAGAPNLSVNTNCSTAPGNMAGATPSAVPLGGSCTGPVTYDVWYKFIAVNTTATARISDFGTNFGPDRGVEILSGTCGSFTSIACAIGTTSPVTATATGLTAGTAYYVRVYSTGPIPNGNARFNICIQSADLPIVRSGNSYVNITRKTTGGVVQPGDTLEIRMTINHTNGTVYRPRYVANIPTHTSMVTGAGNLLGVITNEGLIYHQYTLGGADDAATYIASPGGGEYNIRMNLGFGGSVPGIPVDNTATENTSVALGAMVAGSDRPRGGGGMIFATAYRVVASGTYGDTISLNAGQFIYQTTDGGADITLNSTAYKILITEALNLCENSIGINNASEYGGTFGDGNTLTRTTDLITPIGGYNFVNDVNIYNAVGDGRYSIVKNLSPKNGTLVNARRQSQCDVPVPLAFSDPLNCNNRMYGHWDIGGDHTGTITSTGNTPPAAATPGGYMLMVNADFVASEVYQQTINNLCPDTYYEFSAWIRNICPTCGVDSIGAQFTGTSTAPTLGYPGVYPNLSFALNGVDYYSTGEVDPTGWQKRGFVFRTGASQTSAVFTIRNNAQGGGGNDWSMDDIAVATCLPTMSYSPTINPTICQNNPITIHDTISSYFRNYTTYKWQRSTNSGATWTDISGVTTLPDTNYYITSYTIPLAYTAIGNDDDRYRVVVATTADNLTDPNCNISDGVTISLTVMNCGMVLKTDLLTFSGNLMNNYAVLSWSTAKEEDPVYFELERSDDGVSFSKITTVQGKNNGQVANYYSYTDPQLVQKKKYYRLVMKNSKGSKKYSQVIQLNVNTADFDIDNVVNPFNDQLLFNLSTAKSSKVSVDLINMQGKIVKSNSYLVHAGTNSLRLADTDVLASGIYTLRIQKDDKIINKKVMKRNN